MTNSYAFRSLKYRNVFYVLRSRGRAVLRSCGLAGLAGLAGLICLDDS